MDVTFVRTGRRRYAVVITEPGREPRRMDPAPGYDDHIPHDLVHYLTEAELGLGSGVFGRAAAGGGGFMRMTEVPGDRRSRKRQQRRLNRREAGLSKSDSGDMALSERLAGYCDIAWRRRHGTRIQAPPWFVPQELAAAEGAAAERILDHLDEAAAVWHRLGVGASMSFTWPSTTPSDTTPSNTEQETR